DTRREPRVIPDYPLEPGTAEMRALTERVLELLVTEAERLDESPAAGDPPDDALLAEVSRPPPEGPCPAGPLLDVVTRAAEHSYQTAGPSYLACSPGGGLFTSALAALLAGGLNRYTGKVATAPALVAMEESVLRWLCELFGLPAESQGLLTTGGSMSNLIAVATARTLHAEGRVDRATLYVGEHGHGSLAKAARTAGLAREHVRVV